MQDESATKLQAVWRGHHVRLQVNMTPNSNPRKAVCITFRRRPLLHTTVVGQRTWKNRQSRWVVAQNAIAFCLADSWSLSSYNASGGATRRGCSRRGCGWSGVLSRRKTNGEMGGRSASRRHGEATGPEKLCGEGRLRTKTQPCSRDTGGNQLGRIKAASPVMTPFCCLRGYASRKAIQAGQTTSNEAATLIQQVWRGHNVRKTGKRGARRSPKVTFSPMKRFSDGERTPDVFSAGGSDVSQGPDSGYNSSDNESSYEPHWELVEHLDEV
jgi:hypothetical protein